MKFICGGCEHSSEYHTRHGCQHYGCNCSQLKFSWKSIIKEWEDKWQAFQTR